MVAVVVVVVGVLVMVVVFGVWSGNLVQLILPV